MMEQQKTLDDVVTQLSAGNRISSKLIETIQDSFPRSTGSFTMTAAASRAITDTAVSATSLVVIIPTNASAGTLMGSVKSLYTVAASGSFTVATANAASAAGTETFSYCVFNPI